MPMMARDTRIAPRARPPLRERLPGAVQESAPRAAHSHSRSACPCGGSCPACAGKSISQGQELNKETRSHFESALGAGFGGVRIHTGSESASLAKSLQASAFSVGQDIHFGEGRFRHDSDEGRSLLAHELIHVVQQRHLALGSDAILAHKDHALEKNARDVAAHGAPIARADQPMILRQGENETPHPLTSGLGNMPQLNLGGHTIAGDTQAAQNLLQSQLSPSPLLQPMYLGVPMSLPDISAMLGRVTPALTEQARWSLVQTAWWQKVAALRQLPALYQSEQHFPLPTPSSPGSGGAVTPSVPGVTRVLPTPQQAAANYLNGTGLPDMAPNSGVASQSGVGGPATPGNWQPSAGPQVVINIARGTGTPLAQVAGQRQYTVGDNLQVVFQDSTDAASRQYSAVAGGQALSQSMIDSKIVQLQAFTQLLAGLSQMPGSFSATMVVQWSAGLQLTLKFGPITIQLSAGFQVTAQQGQGSQPAFAFAATAGPTQPAPGTGAQSFGPRNNWWLGIGPPLPLQGGPGVPDRQLGGGMLNFGGNLPSWLQ